MAMTRYTENELLQMKKKYEEDLGNLKAAHAKPIPSDAAYNKSMQTDRYYQQREIESLEMSLNAINSILGNISGSTPDERNASLISYYNNKDEESQRQKDELYSKQQEQFKKDAAIAKAQREKEEQDKIANYNKNYRRSQNGGKYKYNPELYPKFTFEKLYTTRHIPKNIVDELRTFNTKYQKFLWDPYVKRWYMSYSTTASSKINFNGYDKYNEYFCNTQQNQIANEWSKKIQVEQTKPLTPADRPLTLKVHGKLTI